MKNFADQFKLHDKYQVEMKFTYPAAPDSKVNEYSVDTYFFLPTNLGINGETYRKEEFFSDLHEYIRLKTPSVPINGMTGPGSPLEKLEQTFPDMTAKKPDSVSLYSARLKLFCSIMRSAMRDQEMLIENSLEHPGADSLVQSFIDETESILKYYRALYPKLCVQTIPEDVRELFRHADEYLSIAINKYLYKLYYSIRKKEQFSEFCKRIVTHAEQEIEYRKAHNYPSIPDPDGDNEELIYREGTLKKAMASILFLRKETRRDGVLLEHILFSFAAGIAMAFATIMAFITQKYIVQDISLVLFITLVVAYMGKDRIKELLKLYFSRRMHRFIHDYKTRILGENGEKVGFCRESFNFLKESDVPREVTEIRHKAYLSDLENGCFGEQVILARKQVVVNSQAFHDLIRGYQAEGLVDIMRFNFSRFLRHMDNPVKKLFIPDFKGGITSIDAKRVYHVNIVVRYGMKGLSDSYVKFRIVLSRNGIKRINIFPTVTRDSGK
ncbi:MAG: hypothetical protein IKB25_00910 [Lentisphaeria bacterium]|nr:hypothetical protein [Lentisphaeria bacterium]